MGPFALRPSAANKWSVCAGYIAMAKQHPERDGENYLVREEGTAFHGVAFDIAAGRKLWREGDVVDTGLATIDVDDFMLDCAAEYIGEIVSWGIPAYMEYPLHCALIHQQCGGTPDAFAIDYNRRKIKLMDAKYGYRPVNPVQSKQLGCYLAGIVGTFNLGGEWEVEFTIYQPRTPGESFKRWTFPLSEFMEGLLVVLQTGAWNAMNAAALRAGEHCEYCPAAAFCPALRQAGLQVLDVIDVTHSVVLTPHELVFELQMLERAETMLKQRKAALEEEGLFRHKAGEIFPGRTVGNGQSRRRWREGADATVIAMAQVLGRDSVAKPAKAITPTQAEKILGPELVALYSERPQGKLKFMRADASAALKAFSR